MRVLVRRLIRRDEHVEDKHVEDKRGPDVWLARSFLIGLLVLAGMSAVTGPALTSTLGFVPCPVRTVTGVSCPGCGMTRACVALSAGDVGAAWHAQPFVFVIVALAVSVGLARNRSRAAWQRLPARMRTALPVALLGLVIIRWILGAG